jgi:hypothetical protein
LLLPGYSDIDVPDRFAGTMLGRSRRRLGRERLNARFARLIATAMRFTPVLYSVA